MDAARIEFERRLRGRYPGAIVRARDPFATLTPSMDVVWYATNRTYPAHIGALVHIAAPPALVYHVYVERFPDWHPSVRLHRRAPSPEAPGLVFDAEYELLGRSLEGSFHVVESDPPWSVRVEATGAGGIRVWFATSFRPVADGTALEVVGDYDLPASLLPRIQALVVQRIITREIDRAHESLVELCEREATAPLVAEPIEL